MAGFLQSVATSTNPQYQKQVRYGAGQFIQKDASTCWLCLQKKEGERMLPDIRVGYTVDFGAREKRPVVKLAWCYSKEFSPAQIKELGEEIKKVIDLLRTELFDVVSCGQVVIDREERSVSFYTGTAISRGWGGSRVAAWEKHGEVSIEEFLELSTHSIRRRLRGLHYQEGGENVLPKS